MLVLRCVVNVIRIFLTAHAIIFQQPSLPAAHTSAAVYAIAEHAADIIKSAYGFS